MKTWYDIEDRLRRFLRDPDDAIWSSAQLMRFWNDAQIEIAQKTGILEQIGVHRYPPLYDWSYLFDWERQYTEGDRWQVLTQNQLVDGRVIAYPWEPAYWLTSLDTPDEGHRMTHGWEVAHGTISDPIPIPLHAFFDRMKYAAYDCSQIEPIGQHELASDDPWYRTRTGDVSNYWRPDNYHNQVVLYPHPESVSIQGLPEEYEIAEDEGTGVYTITDDHAAYTYGWELTTPHMPSGTALHVTQTYGDGTADEMECTYGWEVVHLGGTEAWEEAGGLAGEDESILDLVGGGMDAPDVGITVDVVDTADALFAVYQTIPADIESVDDESDFASWLLRYVVYATLERAFGADTDGFVPSLRDYWKLRKEIGIRALQRFRRMRLADREFQIGKSRDRRAGSTLKLPAHYPAVYP